MLRKANRPLIVAVVAVAAYAALTLAGTASADQQYNSDVPMDSGVLNPCNGQIVHVVGMAHSTYNVTQGPGGNLNISQHVNFQGVTGTDSLGNTYVIHDSDNGTLHFAGQGGEVFTFPQSFALVTTGSAPNFEVHVLFHNTIATSGNVSAFVNNFTSSCRP